MNTDEGKAILRGFNFNINAELGAVLSNPYQVNADTGEITIPALTPNQDVNIPDGATHIIFKSGFASVNFATGESDFTVSEPIRLATDVTAQSLSLKPANVPAVEGTHFILLAIDFVQSVNNTDYSLNNNAFNVLTIVEVV
jgi:hypothetical protein